jgi:hypothetical protein
MRLQLHSQRALFARRPVLRRALLLLGLLLIPAWQSSFHGAADRLDDAYRNRISFGSNHARMFYFYYYLGLVPVHYQEDFTDFSEAGARRILEEDGAKLFVWHHFIDRASLLLFLPDAFVKGSAESPSMQLADEAAFTLALMVLFVGFWVAGYELLGVCTVLLIGSNPFQLFEVYVNDNVFSWVATSGIAVVGLFLPFLTRAGPPRWLLFSAPLIAGVILGTQRQIRIDGVPILLSALVACTWAVGVRWRVRVAMIALLALSFWGTSRAWDTYFTRAYHRTYDVVSAAGGIAKQDPPRPDHEFWFPFWAGLGDFDGKYGFLMDDRVVHSYLRTHGLPKWVEGSMYSESALRDDFLATILRDPLWYLGIVSQRLWRVTAENTPVRLSLGTGWTELPLPGAAFGALAIGTLVALIGARPRRSWSTRGAARTTTPYTTSSSLHSSSRPSSIALLPGLREALPAGSLDGGDGAEARESPAPSTASLRDLVRDAG